MRDSKHWTHHRKWRVFWLRLLLSTAMLLGAFAVEAVLLFTIGGPAALAALDADLSTPEKMVAACGVQNGASCHLLQSAWFRPGLLAIAVIVTAIAAWRARKGLAESLDDRLFATFDLGRFYEVGGACSAADADRPLPWIRGRQTLRVSAWEKLLDFTIRGGVSSRESHFAWTTLTGQPGIGKSRMAEQLAHLLAAREAEDRPRARAPVLQWLARVLPLLRTRANDQWHAGRLRPRLGDNYTVLGSWRPSRPTLLLLDDPAPGESDQWISEFRAQQESYRFPVRLLIVNQSRATRDAVEAGSDELTPLGPDARLDVAEIRDLLEKLSGERTVWSRGMAVREVLYSSRAMAVLVALTHGNPFLVELCIDWVREQIADIGGDHLPRDFCDCLVRALECVTAKDLIRQRAERVVKALEVAGIGQQRPAQLHALAAAALVGPRARRLPIVEALHADDLPKGEALRRIVPGDTRFEAFTELPCILPHVIGDAAVRLMLEPQGELAHPDDHRKLLEGVVAAAFCAAPGGWIRAQRRFAGQTGLVADALKLPPPLPDDAPLALREETACAFMELGLFGYLPTHESADAMGTLIARARVAERDELRARLRVQLKQILLRDWKARTAGCDKDVEGANPESERDDDAYHRFVHGVPLLLLGGRLIGTGSGGTAAQVGDWLLMLLREVAARGTPNASDETSQEWLRVLRDHVPVWALEDLQRQLPKELLQLPFNDRTWPCWGVYQLLVEVGDGPPDVIERMLWLAAAGSVNSDFSDGRPVELKALLHQAEALETAEAQDARLKALKVLFIADCVTEGFSFERLRPLEVLAGRDLADSPTAQLHRLQALICGTLQKLPNFELDRARAALDRIEAIAARKIFARDLEIQRALVIALNNVAILMDIEEKARIVEKIETICLSYYFRYDAILQRFYLNVLYGIATSSKIARNDSMDVVKKISAIASEDKFITYYDIQIIHASAWHHVAYCFIDDLPTCRMATHRADRCASFRDFWGCELMQAQRLQAWRYLVFAARERAPDEALDAVRRIEAILAQPFRYDASLTRELELARSYLA